ncbi:MULTISPECIES: TetR/AcrR family transcriptional regulator [unclassified Plantibacter]|jgi:DNA-binding transcriptional regulator YbjK|uniref:TetR/AcrR family transcriptional regulator n=1 Tax=unclassified Plantibacter TaxID=2624265 RepID=UPI003D32E0C9
MAARRFDPDRRDRIIDAAIALIAEQGVAGTTHRKVAAKADVPLGSMTYHFDDLGELLHEAFMRFSTTVSDRFEARLRQAGDVASARIAVVEIIESDVLAAPDDLVLTMELYTLAARDPEYRALTDAWMQRSRRALELHFDPVTARELDALIEGISIHVALDRTPMTRELIVDAVDRVTAPRSERHHP